MTIQELITDSQVANAFAGTDFGNRDHREIIKFSVLKYASGFVTGQTAKNILQELGLLDRKENLTTRGKQYLWAAFCYNY